MLGAAAMIVVITTSCGGDPADKTAAPSATVIETVTVTETPSADTETSAAEGDDPGYPMLMPGQTATLGPNDEGESVGVTLHDVNYPKPKNGDKPSKDRAFVVLEMTIRNVSGDSVYGTNVYPDFQTVDGQLIEDTGWVVAAYGNYGTSPEFKEELPDTVNSGQFLQGWSLYEVPPEPGSLIFPYGPSPFSVMVEPPT